MENSKKNQAVQVSNSYWIKVVAIFFVGWILMYATRTIFNPVMGVIGEQFGLSNTQLGLANSIFFLTYAVAQIPFGMIGDKIGRKLVIAVGFIVLAISTYFSGLATTFVMFFSHSCNCWYWSRSLLWPAICAIDRSDSSK